jgi:hypothetical protein
MEGLLVLVRIKLLLLVYSYRYIEGNQLSLNICNYLLVHILSLFGGEGAEGSMPPPHVLVDFVVLPPGHGSSVTVF